MSYANWREKTPKEKLEHYRNGHDQYGVDSTRFENVYAMVAGLMEDNETLKAENRELKDRVNPLRQDRDRVVGELEDARKQLSELESGDTLPKASPDEEYLELCRKRIVELEQQNAELKATIRDMEAEKSRVWGG